MPNDAPAWEDTQELTAEAPTWDATTDLPPAPLRPQRVRAGINETVAAVMRPLDILTSPAAGAASEMGRAVAERNRQAQMRVVAPGAFFPSLAGPEAAPTPEDQAVGQQLVRGITSLPGRVLAAGARTVRDVLSPTTYLPEEMKPAPPFVISTRGDQPAELRQMTRAEEAARDPLQGERGLIPVRGTQLDPEGSQGAQLLSGLSSLDNIGIIATGGASKLAGMALLFSMAPGIYEDVKRIASSETPLEEKQKAINNLIIPLILGAKGAYEGRPVVERPEISGPPVLGSMLRTPGGFTFEGRAAEPVGPVPTPKVFRPEVPGTAAEPRLSLEEEIRAKGARTKEQIRKLFPDLTREQAAAARDRAWGKQPETPAKAPKFEETKPIEPPPEPRVRTEEDRAAMELAQRIDKAAERQAGPPPEPPAAPAAPAAPPPEPTPPPAAPTAKPLPSFDEVKTKVNRGEPLSANEQAVWNEHMVVGSPTAAAAVADYTDIEQANKLSATDLMQALKAKGKGTTAGAYDLGEKLTPESRAKARQYEQAADKEAMDSLARAKAEPDRAKGLQILQRESFPAQQKKQFFNEAGRFYDAVQDVKSGKPLEQAAIDHGVDENVLRRVAEAAPAEAAATLEPKPGYVRLYHGEGATAGAGAGGSWFTDKPDYAAQFGKVSFVDVPADVAAKAREAVRQTGTGGPHFIIPDEYVKQAKEMATQPGAKVFDVTEEPAAPAAEEVPAEIKRRLPVGFDETTARMENGKVVVQQKPLYGGKWMIVDVKKATAEPYVPAAAPTPGTIEATPIAGKTLADWEQATDVSQLPKGTPRAELAKYLAVPNQPSRILAALKNKKRTREIHAPPPAAAPLSISEPSPEAAKMDKQPAANLPEQMKSSDFPPPASDQEPDLVLLGCGKEKAAGNTAVPAADLYTGQLFKGRRGFAESQSRPWMILSAQHGVIEPMRRIAPYDTTLSDLSADDLALWKQAVRTKVLDYFGGSREGTIGKTIEVHAGSDYVKQLNSALEGLGVSVVPAMEGKGIGTQLSIYKQGYKRPQTIAPLSSKAIRTPTEQARAMAAAPAAPEAPEKIVAAAYQPRPGITETGANHPEILKRLGVTGFESPESRNTPQFGFQTDKRGFITREEAGPIAEKSGQNLKEFEPGEPVHSNEVASPTQPEKPLSETGPKAPSAEEPPKVPFEGYAPGTPESKDLRARAEAADTKVSDLYTALSDAEAELKKTKYGTKKQEQLERKVEKLRKQFTEVSQETKLIRQGARLDRLRELAETGDPAQRWAASAEYARKIAAIAEEQLAELRNQGRGQSGDTFYWQVVDRARRYSALAKEISDKGYALFNEKVSKQLQELGATKEEADFEAGQIVNMQFSYPGMKSIAEAPERMRSINLKRLQDQTSTAAKALMKEFGVLADTRFERRAREVMDEKAAKDLLAEHREEYQRRKDEQDRKEKAEAKRISEQQAKAIEEARAIAGKERRAQVAGTTGLKWIRFQDVWKPVEGKTIVISAMPNGKFFVHKMDKGWAVSEVNTGARVGTGSTRQGAIASAETKLGSFKGDFEALVKQQTPKEPPPTPEQLAGPGSPAAGQGPDPVVTGLSAGSPGFNSLARKLRNFYSGIGQLFKRGADKQTLAQLTNAADNIPRIEGQRAGNTIRNRTDAKEQNAITFIMQALKMSGEGISVEATERLGELEFLGDPKGYLETKATDMETKAQEFLHNGQKLEAQAAIDAARHMRYAKNNFGRLRQYAELARRKFDAQYQREQDANIAGDYENWHVPQRHDLDLMTSSDRPIILGHSKGTGTATGFRKAKVFEDYATAIENGFVPRSFNIADLLEHRVNQGERLIQRKALFDRMKSMADPVDGRPLAQNIPKRRITRPDGTIDTQESVPRGYQSFEVLPGYRIAVHDGYAPMMRALTGTSQISESAVVGTLQDIAGVNKHLALALDTFHASRIMQAELALTGKLSVGARQRIGRALVEYDPRDLGAAVRKGEITQEMADYITTPQPMQIGGRTINVSPAGLVKLGIQNGLNAGRFSDALYRDWIREIPITGEVNKWVFDKLSRSAITHGFLAEFERVARNNPELNATQVARKVASDINVLFGNLQKESIFRNPSVKAVNQILFLAPNWVEALARRELRALRQFGEAGRDIIAGRPSGPPIRQAVATGEAIIQPMTRIPRLGTVGRGIGHGLAAYFVGAQVLNLITRGQLTFSNPEPGHKLDAWIPDFSGKTKGFFISPLSVFGEITHDILRYSREKADVASALTQIGANKMGNMGRMVEVLATGRDPASGEKLLGTARRAIAAGMQMVPVPISLSQGLRAAGAAAAPGLITPPAPGAMQRQLLSSAGLKTEPAGTAQRQIYALADKWKSQSGSAKIRAEVERRLKEDFGPSDYKDLRTALLRNDLSGARRAFDDLRKTKEPQVINRAMRHPHPFTGSAQAERAFVRSLSDEDKKLYREALEERKLLYSRYRQMLAK